MLWYLLGPVRGTTQPPRLSANHPVRRAFYRHGKVTARHWLLTMLVSVAIAMAFSYPTILLSWNPTAGLAAQPHHVWTTAKTINETLTKADIEMRQLWIHGSFMRALDKEVLKQGLLIQRSLLGNGASSHAASGFNQTFRQDNLQWGYHSPLMYWNNSVQIIDDDPDILKTINEQRHSSSSLNVVLRPASVFAGKRFGGQRLLAADALVITLINKAEEEDVGNQWRDKMLSLAQDVCINCTLFPPDGRLTRHGVYEFSLKPLSLQENLALALAYGLMALYVLISFRRMKAFHSRFGLFVTAITQFFWSVLGSFTICGILHINLAMIPRNAYPFVVLVIGLENMFRIINAVLAYPPTMATDLRIANALGDTGPLSVATAAQNMIILSLLSMVVSPGVAAFCAFAAIATLFDVFFLLTFFVAVLNVDIRRFELQDAITARLHSQPRPSRHRRRPLPSRPTWFDALLSGRLPFSTRMAGTAVTTTFILSLNYHFFERKEMVTTLRQLFGVSHGGLPSLADFDAFASPPMNASLTPGEWMRMQDFDTAKEVMRLAKPGESSFVMKIFAPLIVVLSGSDRANASLQRNLWPHAVRSFALHHFYPVAVAVVFGVAFVAVLMNFLLYNESGDEASDLELDQTDDILSAHSIRLPHKLDIVRISGNKGGHVVTIALDRTIVISTFVRDIQAHRTILVQPEVLSYIKWPVLDLAIDETGEWIACRSADQHVFLYNHTHESTKPALVPCPDDRPAVVFTFAHLSTSSALDRTPFFVMLTSEGRSTMSFLDDYRLIGSDISLVPLIGGTIADMDHIGSYLFVVTGEAKLVCYTWEGSSWCQVWASSLEVNTPYSWVSGAVSIDLCGDQGNGVIIVTMPTGTIFVDWATQALLATLDIDTDESDVNRTIVGALQQCPTCDGPAFSNVVTINNTSSRHHVDMLAWSLYGDNDKACLCLSQGSSECRSFESAPKAKHEVSSPGAWAAIKSLSILGLRRRQSQSMSSSRQSNKNTSTATLKQRRHARHVSQSLETSELWEAYKLNVHGETETVDVVINSNASSDEEEPLYVDQAGPIVILDEHAVAVGFGNTIKIIGASRRVSFSRRSAAPSLERKTSTTRRRSIIRKQR